MTFSRAAGPCTATMPKSGRSVTATSNAFACSVIHARSFSRVAALTTRRKNASSMK